MEISELSRKSDIPISTIKYYLRMGLLPRPVKTGKTKAQYTREYINRLKLIRKLKEEESMPIKKISEIIEIIDDWKAPGENKTSLKYKGIRSLIIEISINLFRKKGYDNTTVADIVDASKIGRGTFYKHFKNKKLLLTECVKSIIVNEAKAVNMVKAGTHNKNNLLVLFDERSQAYFKEYPLWKDMINILRVAVMNDPCGFAGQLKEALDLKVNLYAEGIKKYIRDGFFRDINPLVVGVMLLGIQEYCDEFFSNTSSQMQEKVRNDINNILLNGMLKNR